MNPFHDKSWYWCGKPKKSLHADSIDGKYVDKLLYDFTLEVGDTLRMDEGSYYHRPEDGDDWNAIPGRKRCGDRMYRKNDPYGELDPYSGFEVIGIDSIVVDGQNERLSLGTTATHG